MLQHEKTKSLNVKMSSYSLGLLILNDIIPEISKGVSQSVVKIGIKAHEDVRPLNGGRLGFESQIFHGVPN
jgi:hypothetical protein